MRRYFWKVNISFKIKRYYNKWYNKWIIPKLEEVILDNKSSFYPTLVLSPTEELAKEKALSYVEDHRSKIEWDLVGNKSSVYNFNYMVLDYIVSIEKMDKTYSFSDLEKYATAEDFISFCRQEWEKD